MKYILCFLLFLGLFTEGVFGQRFSQMQTARPVNSTPLLGGLNDNQRKITFGEMKDSFNVFYPTIVSGLVETNNAPELRGKKIRETSGRVSYVDMSGKRITIANSDFTEAQINTKIGNVVYTVSDASALATATEDTTIVSTSTLGGVYQFAASSTFSGWSSEVGIPNNFKLFSFTINAFDAANIPNKLRVRLYSTASVIYDDSFAVSLVLNTAKTVTIALPTSIKNNSLLLSLDVLANGRLSLAGNNSPTFTATRVGSYSTSANIANIGTSPASGGIGAYTIKCEFRRTLATGVNFLPLAEKDIALKLGFVSVPSDSLLVAQNGSWLYESSTFSGWGWSSRVIPPPFSEIRLKVRGFDPADLPTQIVVRVKKNSSSGEVVAQKTVPFLTTNDLINIDFGQSYTMADTAWVEYQTDGKVGLFGQVQTTTWRQHQYSTSQNLSETPTVIVTGGNAYAGYSVFKGGFGWELNNAVQSVSPAKYIPKINLPRKIRATVGKPVQLFYRSFIESVNIDDYVIKISGNQDGSPYPRYFEFTPTSTGLKSVIVSIYDAEGILLIADTLGVDVKSANANPASAKKILPIGDSLTDAGTWTGETIRMLSGTGGTPVGKGYTNVQFIGTKGSGTNKYEGYGGKTWQWYSTATTLSDLDFHTTHNKTAADLVSIWVDANARQWRLEAVVDAGTLRFSRIGHSTNPPSSGILTYVSGGTNTSNISYVSVGSGGVVNPFWNTATAQLDFASYVSANGFGTIDGAVILLGWNQISNPSATVTAAKVLIDKLRLQYPAVKIKIVGLQPPSLNGGLAANYGASAFWQNPYEISKEVWALNKAYDDFCAESAYASFCEYVDIASVYDAVNNNHETLKTVNNRNTKTEFIGTNGVHPATQGYYQIADAVFSYIIADFCQ